MKRKFRFVLPAVMACFALAGCENNIFKPKKDYGEYFEGYDMTLKGDKLARELQKLSFTKHTKWITYGQITSYYVKTSDHDSSDAIAEGSDKYELFYTGGQKSTYSSSSENREHVWPCANSSSLWSHDQNGNEDVHYVDNKYYIGGGSDLFHVRPCNGNVNTARGNSKFVDFSDSEFESLRPGCIKYGDNYGTMKLILSGADTSGSVPEYAQKCEVDDNMKGDVARLIAYVWMHYTERGVTPDVSVKSGGLTYRYKDMTGQLSLKNILGYEDINRCKEVLKEWNDMDEPSEVEKLRNDTVEKIQGNRNPFVDYPELLDRMF